MTTPTDRAVAKPDVDMTPWELPRALAHLESIGAVNVERFSEWAALNPGGVWQLIRSLACKLPVDWPERDAILARAREIDAAQQPDSERLIELDYMPGELDRTAPPRIWLQIDADGEPSDRSEPFPDLDGPGDNGVSWCWHQIGGTEIQYVRADLVAGALVNAAHNASASDERTARAIYERVCAGEPLQSVIEDYDTREGASTVTLPEMSDYTAGRMDALADRRGGPGDAGVPEWLDDVRRALDDVDTQFRASGQCSSRFVQLIARMDAWRNRARSTPAPAAVPDGWKLVPENASAEWLAALRSVRIGSIETIINDVLAAAPTPPATEPEPNAVTLAAIADSYAGNVTTVDSVDVLLTASTGAVSNAEDKRTRLLAIIDQHSKEAGDESV